MWKLLARRSHAAYRSPILRSRPASLQARYISTDKYHQLADETLEMISDSFEEVIEQRPEVDVDLSQGVLTLMMPNGTYVINKQPPNMQIWLSSPVSGPKRYDWDENKLKWIYQRENSSLGELLKQETRDALGIDLDLDVD